MSVCEEILAEGIRIICGDCREVLPTLPRVDALVTDPPYGINLGAGDQRGGKHGLARSSYGEYADTLENFRHTVVPAIKAALALAERGAVFCTLNLHELPKPDAIGGVYVPAAAGRHCWGYASLLPVGFYGVAPDLNYGSRPSAISSSELVEPNSHPCPKPLGWMRWLVGHASRVNESILDPFMGSGTTGVAAVQLDRKFIGIEIEPKYFDIACRRISAALAEPRLPFAEKPKAATQPDLIASVTA